MRIVSFADGFTSNTEPPVSGASEEVFSLLNNQASFADTGLVFDSTKYSSAFMSCEIERQDGTTTYREVIEMTVSRNNGQWYLNLGAFSGYELVKDAITLGTDMVFTIDSALGKVQYKSGNLSGHVSTKFKPSIIRIAA